MKKFKKVFKIAAVFLVIFIGVIIAIPLLFEDKITGIIKDTINENLNAELNFSDADISLLSSFPKATVAIENATLINLEPFKGDTLFAAQQIKLKMSVTELFKGSNEAIDISYFSLDNALVNVLVNDKGDANYDIAKTTKTTTQNKENEDSQSFNFSVRKYELKNSQIHYNDMAGGVNLRIENFNHAGSGDLSLNNSELNTTTQAVISLAMDSINYLNKNKLKLDATIGIDLKENKYSFLNNKIIINQLAVVFDGFVKINDTNQEVAVNFKTPSSDFKNFLAVIPEAYSKDIENVKTEGNFELKGSLNGIVDDTRIPAFDITIVSKDAMFKYPDLPKSIENIQINTQIVNKTGITNDTYVLIDKLSFTIDEDTFNANAKLENLVENPFVNAHIDGRLNLGKISQAYPVSSEINLKGVLEANVSTQFDMSSLENKRYENTKNKGILKLKDFEYVSEEVANPITISEAEVSFNPKTVTLNQFDAKTGQTDFKATGTIKNLLGFLFNNENVEGDFELISNQFSVSDFMVASEDIDENTTTDKNIEEQIKIPSFLDATVRASAGTVLYDNLTLKNVNGTIVIKDEKASLVNVTSNLFDGNLGLNGSVSTKETTPVFDMNLVINAFDITQSFTNLDLFKALSPIASVLSGKLNTTLSLSGNLNNDFTPNLATITGNALAELLASSIQPEKSKVLNSLGSNLNFVDFKQLNLKKLKTSISFENGKAVLKPTKLNYKDIDIDIEGGHTFDKSLAYKAIFNVPAKYLGSEASGLLAKLNDEDMNDTKVPVIANISGNITNPTINTDLKQAVSNLTRQLAKRQKDKLIGKGKDKTKDIIGGLLKKGDTPKDSTEKKDPVKGTADKLINNFFRKKKKEKDSIQK